MFRRYADDGAAIADLRRWLTGQGVRTRTGKERWDRSVIWGMLRNPAYAGTAVFGKTQAVHEAAGLNRTARLAGRTVPRQVRVEDRPREEWTAIPVPALVDQDMFNRVQQRLEDNKRFAARNTKVPSLLQGLAACASCGYGYYRTSTTTSSGKKIYYYRCLGSDDYRYQGGRVCGNKPVRADYANAVIWDHVTGLLADPALIRTEIDRRLERARTSNPVTRKRGQLEQALAKTSASIAAMVTAFSEQLLTIDELRARMPALRARETGLKDQIAALDAQAADRDAYLKLADDLQAFLGKLHANSATATTEDRQRVLRAVVQDILIGPGKLTIRHRIPIREPSSGSGHHETTDTEGDMRKSSQLRWGRDHRTLRGAGQWVLDPPVFHHPCAQHGAQQLQDAPVADAFLNRLHQLILRNLPETVLDVRLDHPAPAPPGLIDEHLQGITRVQPGPEPETARQETGLEHRLKDDPGRGLHDPVGHRGNRQWPPLPGTARLGNINPPGREGTVAAISQRGSQLTQEPAGAVLLHLGDADPVDARCAVVPAHLNPRALQHVCAADLVEQRMEPPPGISLGRPVKHVLQSADPVTINSTQGGPNRVTGTHRPHPSRSCMNEAAALPSPPVLLSGRLKQYYGRLRLPPGQQPISRFAGYKAPRSGGTAHKARPHATGPGRVSQVPAATIDTFRAPYAGESFAAALPGSTPLPWPSP